MPVLKNARHETVAQALAQGKNVTEAYASAGFKPNRSHASRLVSNGSIRKRVAEIQGRAAERAAVTIGSLTEELEEARAMAMAEKQTSAAVAATLGKAKLHGLLVDKKQHSGPGGGPITTVDLSKMSSDDIERLEALFGPLASGSGDDDESDQGGEGQAAS